MDNKQFEFLDVITILSFALQVENQSKVIGLTDIQNEINAAVSDIHEHLKMQDMKLELLLERMDKHEAD